MPKIQTHVLAHGRKIGPVHTQQSALKTDTEAYVDIRHTNMGIHKTVQKSHNKEISKQILRNHKVHKVRHPRSVQ